MQKFYARAEDLHVNRNTLDAPDEQVREVYVLDVGPGGFAVPGVFNPPFRGGYAAGEQE